jgi:hypothetical protein
MPPQTISLEELSDLFEEMASVSNRIAGVGVTDSHVAAYARALEYGSVAGQRPWPHPGERTVAGVDPETGAEVVVSVQAPQGFIRMRASSFLERLREAVAGPTNWLDAEQVDQHFSTAVQTAAAQVLEDLRAAVPRDSGRLAASLTIIET